MNKNLTIYSSFIIASLVVIAVFLTATTYIQLVIAIVLYPLIAYFGFKAFPRKMRTFYQVTPTKPLVVSTETTMPAGRQVETVKTEKLGIADIDKRLFLKLIGGTGTAFFLYSIFNKKTNLFQGIAPAAPELTALKDTSGNKIDPAQTQPTDGYRISEIEDNAISFYGYTNTDNAWYIMRVDTDTGSIRYARGDGNFPGNWTGRENLKYDYFNNVF